MMRSKLLELEKLRDKYDVKYETSRLENMVGFGNESAFEARQHELEEINRKKMLHDEKLRQDRERVQEEERERQSKLREEEDKRRDEERKRIEEEELERAKN